MRTTTRSPKHRADEQTKRVVAATLEYLDIRAHDGSIDPSKVFGPAGGDRRVHEKIDFSRVIQAVDFLSRASAWVHRECEPLGFNDARPGSVEFVEALDRMRAAHARAVDDGMTGSWDTEDHFGRQHDCYICGTPIVSGDARNLMMINASSPLRSHGPFPF